MWKKGQRRYGQRKMRGDIWKNEGRRKREGEGRRNAYGGRESRIPPAAMRTDENVNS